MIVDVVVIAVIAVSVVISILRGFIRETLTIVAVIVAFAAAYFGGEPLAKQAIISLGIDTESEEKIKLLGFLSYDLLIHAISYASIFFIVLVIFGLISQSLTKAASEMGLGPIDRTFGLIFGFVRAVLLLALAYIPVHSFVEKETKEKWFEGSQTHQYIEWSSGVIINLLPENLKPPTKENISTEGGDKARDMLKNMNLLKGDEIQISPEDVKKLQETLKESINKTESSKKEEDQVPPKLIENAEPGYEEDLRKDLLKLLEQQTAQENQ